MRSLLAFLFTSVFSFAGGVIVMKQAEPVCEVQVTEPAVNGCLADWVSGGLYCDWTDHQGNWIRTRGY